MKTFNEALLAALFVGDGTDQTLIDASAAKQLAFVSELKTNPKMYQVVFNATTAFISATAVVPSGDAGDDEIMDLTMSLIYSAFMWGMTVGREMEMLPMCVDEPAAVAVVAAPVVAPAPLPTNAERYAALGAELRDFDRRQKLRRMA